MIGLNFSMRHMLDTIMLKHYLISNNVCLAFDLRVPKMNVTLGLIQLFGSIVHLY